jgi:hypothetical protein
VDPGQAYPSKPLPTGTGTTTTPAEDGAHHQPTSGARIRKDDCPARHTICQYTITVHFTVQHTVTASTWPIKGGGRRPAAGGLSFTNMHMTMHHSHFLPTILALASIKLVGTWRICLFSPIACSPLLRASRCKIIQCAHTICWTYGRGRNQDKYVSLC